MRWGCTVAIAWGCYAPHPQPGAPCADGVCPTGLVCIAGSCEPPGFVPPGDAGRDARPRADAALDAAIDAPAGPQLVAQTSNHASNGAMLTASLATTAGELLVMTGAAVHGPLTSVSGGGATWTLAARAFQNTNVEIWYGISDGTSGDVTIALTLNDQDIWMVVSAWSGMATTNPLDAATATSGTTSPADAGPITTTHAFDLIILAVADMQPNTFGAPSMGVSTALDTIEAAGFSPTQAEWYRFVTTTGTFDPHVSETGHMWDAAVAAFKVAP